MVTLLFSTNSPNLVMFAVRDQSLDFVKQFLDLLKGINNEEFEKMLFMGGINDRNALLVAALNPNSEVFKYIVDFYESFTTSDELNELLMQKYKFQEFTDDVDDIDNDTNILHSAIMYDRHVDIIIQLLTLKLSRPQRKTMLVEVTRSDGNNLLQYAINCSISDAGFECLFDFIGEVLGSQVIENFLLHENLYGLKAFDLALLG